MHLQEATLASKTRTLVAIEELERLVPVLKVGPLQLGLAVKVMHTQVLHLASLQPGSSWESLLRWAQLSQSGMAAREGVSAAAQRLCKACQLQPITSVG